MLFEFFCASALSTNDDHFFDYENLVVCVPSNDKALPDGISDLFKLIFSRSIYSSQPVFESSRYKVEGAVAAIEARLGCLIVNTKYFDLESETSWKNWKKFCANLANKK